MSPTQAKIKVKNKAKLYLNIKNNQIRTMKLDSNSQSTQKQNKN